MAPDPLSQSSGVPVACESLDDDTDILAQRHVPEPYISTHKVVSPFPTWRVPGSSCPWRGTA